MNKFICKKQAQKTRKKVSIDIRLIALVKLLARWAAEEDYKALKRKRSLTTRNKD